MDIHKKKIIVLDFGAQYTQLIARRVREKRVYCEIYPFNTPYEDIIKESPSGIILSGGPHSVYEDKAPLLDTQFFKGDIPILGICYGMQLIAHSLGGKVLGAEKHEYGNALLHILDYKDLFYDFNNSGENIWMSHADRVVSLPLGFNPIAYTDNSKAAAIAHICKPIWGVQFHPEVVHTPRGEKIIGNFLFRVCGCIPSWTMSSFVEYSATKIKEQVGSKKVICALSGGVDSSVTAALIQKAIGNQLTCIFVNNGLLRKNEERTVQEVFHTHFHINFIYCNAKERFLKKLAGVLDPEIKRKTIGNEFIYIFEEEANKIKDVEFLAQGTLYPDVIESVSVGGPSATIKSHHNVGGLPEKMNLRLVEPLRELFKDEVRKVGSELGLPDEIINRQPFPGPGLAIRIIGEVTETRLDLLRNADAIIIEEIKKAGLYNEIWQSFGVLLPIKTVGVMGDRRTYENVIALRAVNSNDGMTADWVKLPYELIGRISNRIINEVSGINRVVYDVSSKPPSTIEWE